MNVSKQELLDALIACRAVIEDFMPNIGQCVLQNYAGLNTSLIESARLINKAQESVFILPTNYNQLTTKKRKAVREEYIRRQEGKCFFCKELLTGPPPLNVNTNIINWHLFPSNFTRHSVHLQHNHETNLTEGAVHALCNAYWWQYHGR
jgi:hypothetical protein